MTVAQFRAYLKDSGDHLEWPFGLDNPANHPMRYLTWHEATRYCAWLTATLRTWPQTPLPLAEKLAAGWQIMLPSEAEWERAARGSNGRIYPWEGNVPDSNRANYDATGIGTTSAVGCFPAGATPEGVEELSGNVWEWTRSLYMEYPYPSDEQARGARERLQAEDNDIFVLTWLATMAAAIRTCVRPPVSTFARGATSSSTTVFVSWWVWPLAVDPLFSCFSLISEWISVQGS
ncbi:MAG: SUMF1/EgtB/PvdO family nonheme iron enzyme [Caldilineaceae bacterium]